MLDFFKRSIFGEKVELRTGEWGTSHLIPRSAWLSDTGLPISESDAYGLPAVSNIIRSCASLTASLPFFVYKEGEIREPARDSWQWKLLHDQPSAECSSFDFFYDLGISLEATQNAFVRKTRFRKELIELEVLDPHRVSVNVDPVTGEKSFDIWVARGNVIRGVTPREILHIRGFSPNPGSEVGLSLIQVHANVLSAQRAEQKFEGDYFRNQGVPPFWFTGAANSSHAQQIIDTYNLHRTQGSSRDPGALWGTIDVKHLPISMVDAEYIANKNLSTEDACAIWDWPVWMVRGAADDRVDPNARMSEFLRTKFLPRLRRIERAFAADPDVFSGKPLFGEFLIASLERADFASRVRGYKDAIQGGWVAPNEIRKWENMPPSDDPRADELQQTPVGGAANEPKGSPNVDA